MHVAATPATQWIPSKFCPDEDSPVVRDALLGSAKRENYYPTSVIYERSKMEARSEVDDLSEGNVNRKGAAINEASPPNPPVRINHRAQIDVIDIEEGESKDRKHVLIYEEQQTNLVILKILKSKQVREVANELVEIVTTIGAPRIIQSGHGRNHAEQVVREIRLMLRDFCVVHGDASKNNHDRRDFRIILRSWMKNHPGRSLNEALRIVQVIENTTTNSRHGTIPSQLFFGRNICEDLRRTIGTKGPQRNSCFKVNSLLTDKIVITPETEKSVTEIKNDKVSETNISSGLDLVSGAISSNVEGNTKNHDSPEKEDLREMEKCFECEICQKNYTKLAHLRNHMRAHTRNNNFTCSICNQTFRSGSVYDMHMKESHEQQEMSEKDDGNESEYEDRLEPKSEEENPVSQEEKAHSLEAELSEQPKSKGNCKRRVARSLGARKLPKNTKTRKKRCSSLARNKLTDNSLLECTYCQQSFTFPSVLKRHMRSHTNERPYVCEICNKSFKQLGHLSQHALTHTDYRSFRCTICSIKFDSLESLKLHSNSHETEQTISRWKKSYRLFECDICNKVFTTKSVLERHIFTHTHERKFSCKICGKRFKQSGHVKNHMLVHTGERKFQCDICTKRFSLSNSLKKHMYVHNGDKPYQCDICGSRFLEKRNLNGHLMTHTNEKPFSCKICGKRYTLADTLRRHVSAAHQDGRTYQCEICAKMFKQLAHLSVHKKVHNDERPFQCHLCEKNFKHKNVLKSHLAIHANVRPFECDTCKATFVRKTNLQTHIASAHMNERPYVCTICNKRFKQMSHLNGHIVVHTNSMPYQCDFCDRRCNRLDNLKKHMRLHTKTAV